MKKIVISLGGSVINDGSIKTGFLSDFVAAVRSFSRNNLVAVIAGGGSISRDYQSAAKRIAKLSDHELDDLGIEATKLNASLIRALFGGLAYGRIVHNPASRIHTKKRIIIGSGWKPGFSTDRDAVLLARNLGAKNVVNLTNVPYVYDKNPKKFRNAKAFTRLRWDDYLKIVGRKWSPGLHAPFDPVASMDAKKYGIKVIVMQGVGNLKSHLSGKKYEGTLLY